MESRIERERLEGERKERPERKTERETKGSKCKRVGRKGPRHAFCINYTARFPLPTIRPTAHHPHGQPSSIPFRSRRSDPARNRTSGTGGRSVMETARNGQLCLYRETASFRYIPHRSAGRLSVRKNQAAARRQDGSVRREVVGTSVGCQRTKTTSIRMFCRGTTWNIRSKPSARGETFRPSGPVVP
ncbi:Uncharacterised protein [Klebsiella pneumoniae]|nr:Uncharacterised protein [Klebsiella pneumoniae]